MRFVSVKFVKKNQSLNNSVKIEQTKFRVKKKVKQPIDEAQRSLLRNAGCELPN